MKLLKNVKHYKKEKHTKLKYTKLKYTKLKLKLKYTKFNLPQGITIFRNVVVILSWVESPTAIKIENETISNQLKEFFLGQWKIAK